MSHLIATAIGRALSGKKNGEGLLEPLPPNFRPILIHYAQMTGAAADLYDSNTKNSKALMKDFFSEACLVKGNPYKYKVTHFLYAGRQKLFGLFQVPWSWIGYVAVITDESKLALGARDILVAFRGTSGLEEWANNTAFFEQWSASELLPTAAGADNAYIHRGFYDLYTGTLTGHTISLREQVHNAVRYLVNMYKDDDINITVTGFSMGGAMATLSAMDIFANGYNKPTTGNLDKSFPVMGVTYGSPRFGDKGLESVYKKLEASNKFKILRIVNYKDGVPDILGLFGNYVDLGLQLNVNTSISNYLQERTFGRSNVSPEEYGDEDEERARGLDIAQNVSAHNMDVYAHGIAIKGIITSTPVDKLEHDIALVNKYLDRMKPEYKIPPNWWVGANRKKMRQLDNGRWMVV